MQSKMEEFLMKYREFFDEPDDFEKGVFYATQQVLEILENAKTKINLNPNEEFWYIDISAIKSIKEEFGI